MRQSIIRWLLSIFIPGVLAESVHAQTLDESFQTNIRKSGFYGNISDIAIQPDGKIIIAGDFAFIGTVRCNGLARLNPDGSLDPLFNAAPIYVNSDNYSRIEIQTDGKILAVGNFTRMSGNQTVQKGLIRINSDGTEDESLLPNDLPPPWSASNIAIQNDQKIVIAWRNEVTKQTSVARLEITGEMDEMFNCGLLTGQSVTDLALQSDGKIIVVGNYLDTNQANLFKRFNTNGSDDTAFNTTVQVVGDNSRIHDVTISPTGDIFINGSFTTCNGLPRKGIAKYDSNGQLKTGFNPAYTRTNGIEELVLSDDGKIQVHGYIEVTDAGTTKASRFVQLNADGSVDTMYPNFTTDTPVSFYCIRRDSNKKLLFAGSQVTLDGVATRQLGRFNADLSIDRTFALPFGTEVYPGVFSMAIQIDKKIVIGGDFNYVDNTSRNNIARLNFDGSLDATFDPGVGANGPIYAVLIQPDGKIIVGGAFTHFDYQPKKNILRLNTDGSIDESFNADGDDVEFYFSFALQSDAKIIVKGKPKGTTPQLRRLNVDGSPDISFAAAQYNKILHYGEDHIQGSFTPVAVQADGKIITEHLRFNKDGSRDLTFVPNFNSYFVSLEADGKIIMRGGGFGYTPEESDGLHRVNEDGSVAQEFDHDFQENCISAVYIQPNKKILASIKLEPFADPTTSARLNADGTIDATYNGRSLLHWERQVMLGHGADLVLVAGRAYHTAPYFHQAVARLKTNTLSEQSLIFSQIPDQTYQSGAIEIPLPTVTATSGLPVTFEVLEGSASVTNAVITISAPGKIVIKASQTGNDTYYAAPPVTRTFFAKQNQEIDFDDIADLIYDDGLEVDLVARSNSRLPVAFEMVNGAATISGSTLFATSSGKITVKAFQSGNDFFHAAESVTITFYVKESQTINFQTIAAFTFSSEPISLAATATSGLPVLFDVVSGNFQINDNTAIALAPGSVTVKASQSGNDYFFGADDVLHTFCVNPLPPSVDFDDGVLISNGQGIHQWFKNGSIISNASQQTLSVSDPGEYTVRVAVDGCTSDHSQSLLITGVEEEKPAVKIYPNPASKDIVIELHEMQDVFLTLYNMVGKVVSSQAILRATGNYTLHIEELPRGTYVLKISQPQGVLIQKVILN